MGNKVCKCFGGRDDNLNELPAILPFSINYRAKNNAISSSTEQYDLVELHDTLVIRRGEAFDVKVKFNRDYVPKYDDHT